MTRLGSARGLMVFFFIWLGQFGSLLGSDLTSFALSVVMYQRTGSATSVGLISASAVVLRIFVAPFAGALVDRWNRRRVMILSDSASALGTLLIALLLLAGQIETWHVCLLVAVDSVCRAFQRPAYQAAISLLVPKKHLGRANGMVQVAYAVRQIAAPALAGALLMAIQAEGIVLVDFATFLLAIITLLMVRIPQPKPAIEKQEGKDSLLQDISSGWTYLTMRRGLLALLALVTMGNFTFGFIVPLFTPLVLSCGFSPAVLGQILAIGGVGMLVGSLIVSAWGGPKRRINGLIVARLLEGVSIVLIGFGRSPVLFGAAAFSFFFALPFEGSSVRVIMQTKVAADMQGRVFSLMEMLGNVILLIAYPAAGPLADYVFEPLLSAEGALSDSVGMIIGVGPGRGVALLFVLSGLFLLGVSIGGYLYPRLRLVENELPDKVDDGRSLDSEGTGLAGSEGEEYVQPA
jgi:DHA3 family macrolide efflux protein-like MFS transporter